MENVTPDIMIKMVSVSVILALLFTVPALGIFLGIYWHTDNLVIGAIMGFSTVSWASIRIIQLTDRSSIFWA